MTIKEVTTSAVKYLRKNKTLTRMLISFGVGVAVGALLF